MFFNCFSSKRVAVNLNKELNCTEGFFTTRQKPKAFQNYKQIQRNIYLCNLLFLPIQLTKRNITKTKTDEQTYLSYQHNLNKISKHKLCCSSIETTRSYSQTSSITPGQKQEYPIWHREFDFSLLSTKFSFQIKDPLKQFLL